MDFLFVQKIVHKPTGQEFDLGFLSEFTLVETMDLSGPKVIMRVRDNTLYLQDNLKIKAEDELTITLADVFANEGMDAVMDFTILSCPQASGNIVINCMKTAVYETKKPAKRASLFPVGSASNVLGRFFPGLKLDLPKLPVSESYHVLAGERPSYALKQMAMEQGGHIFFSRDKVVVRRISDLIKQEPEFKYHGGDNREEMQIITYQVKKPEQVLKDRCIRNYYSFSITDGFISSKKNAGGIPMLYGSSKAPVLDGINAVPSPVIDFTVSGNGKIRAGSVIGFEWHTARKDAPLNEALPEKVVVWCVAHYFGGGKFFTRVKGCIDLQDK